MLRKNIAPVIVTALSCLLFIIIGSCFSAFVYKKEIVKIESPKLLTNNKVYVYDESGKNLINELKLSKMKLGLKPVTGEEDKESNIPVTVTDSNGSEGQYSKFKVKASQGAKIYVKNIVIETENKKIDIEKEKEHIMVAIKQINGSSTNFKQDVVCLGEIEASDNLIDLTLFIWLSGKTSTELKAAKISFDLSFE